MGRVPRGSTRASAVADERSHATPVHAPTSTAWRAPCCPRACSNAGVTVAGATPHRPVLPSESPDLRRLRDREMRSIQTLTHVYIYVNIGNGPSGPLGLRAFFSKMGLLRGPPSKIKANSRGRPLLMYFDKQTVFECLRKSIFREGKFMPVSVIK